MTVTYTDEEDDKIHELIDLMVPLFAMLAPILERAANAHLISPTEQAELIAFQQTMFDYYKSIEHLDI